MRNPEKWRPTRLVRDPRSGQFRADRRAIFGGSHYIADLQMAAYVPLIQQHISGHVLDCGCGPVPYHELYASRTTANTCIDWSAKPAATELLDQVVDLNGPLPFAAATFDSVLLTDVLAHIRDPWSLIGELSRVLKPGGTMVLTTPFLYWLAEYPHEYYHPSRFALEDLCARNGLSVKHLQPYGGRADVFLDSLNKVLQSGNGYRLFRVLRWCFERTGWPVRDRKRTAEHYALGYCLVAQKKAL